VEGFDETMFKTFSIKSSRFEKYENGDREKIWMRNWIMMPQKTENEYKILLQYCHLCWFEEAEVHTIDLTAKLLHLKENSDYILSF
jgi:hypothetical protein